MRYTTVTNRVIESGDLDAAEEAFLIQLEEAVADDRVSPDQMRAFVYGPDNPTLDRHAVAGQAVITKGTLGNPIFRVAIDCLTRKDIRLGRINLAQMHAAYTIDVPTAAERLGVSPQAVRAGIDSFKHDALFANGQWWLRPEAVAALRLSREGGRLVPAAHAP